MCPVCSQAVPGPPSPLRGTTQATLLSPHLHPFPAPFPRGLLPETDLEYAPCFYTGLQSLRQRLTTFKLGLVGKNQAKAKEQNTGES